MHSNTNLEIILYCGDMKLAMADYIHVDKDSGKVMSITFYAFKMTGSILLEKDTEIWIEITYKTKVYTDIFVALLEEKCFKQLEELNIKCAYVDKPWGYDQYVIDIFKAWNENQPIHWRSLSARMKYAWVKACLHWSGLPTHLGKNQNFIVEGNLVKQEVDFYCLLGEVFFGERGYFGQDLNGLSDCMSEFYMKEFYGKEPHKCTVLFTHVDKLDKILNKKIHNYMDIVVNLFERYGFTVKISR